ncbi:MAG: hypothetical protein ACXAAR_03540, partial [Candidatus Thorarchaeota archaeon]
MRNTQTGQQSKYRRGPKWSNFQVHWTSTLLAACAPLYREAQYAKKLTKLEDLIRPPVMEVVIGTGEKAAAIGGKLVLYRHDLRYSNPISFFVDVADTLEGDALSQRVKAIEDWTYVYI